MKAFSLANLSSNVYIWKVALSQAVPELNFTSYFLRKVQQLQALALQPAVWGISCLVLLPSSCNDSSLYSSSGPALADAGPNARPGHGAQCKTLARGPSEQWFYDVIMLVNRVTIVVEHKYTVQH